MAQHDILRFSRGAKHNPDVDAWFTEGAVGLQSLAQKWFERMRQCGDDVLELVHDGCPVGCVDDARASWYRKPQERCDSSQHAGSHG